jgi:cell division protease FtsH
MACEFGLSPALGPVGYPTGAPVGPEELGRAVPEELVRRPYSEQTQRVIDEEVTRLLRQAEQRAVGLLHTHRTALDRLAALLVEQETVDGAVVLKVLADEHAHPPGRDEPVGVAAVGARSTEEIR